MKTLSIRLVLSAVALSAVSAWGLGIGSTKEEALAELGKPAGTGKRGGSEFFYYGGGVVEIKNGKVVSMDGSIAVYVDQTAKGLVQVDGRWVTPAQKKAIEKQKRAAAEIGPKIKVIAQGGRRIDLRNVIVPGKVTIVDFYADWCAPCRAMSPHLEALAKEDADIFLRKVDIVRWDSEVAKQYDLHSIPDVRVFDRQGKQVGSATYDLNDIIRYTMRAR
ncbi:MAG: thioredoxin family protein [bacterium]